MQQTPLGSIVAIMTRMVSAQRHGSRSDDAIDDANLHPPYRRYWSVLREILSGRSIRRGTDDT